MFTASLVCRERPGPGEFYKFHTRPPAWSALSPACPSGSPRSWPARCPGCARAGSSGRPAPLPHWLSPAVQISGLAGERRPGLGCSLDVEEYSEELLCQQSYAIKNQLGHPKPPTRGFGTQNTPIVCLLLAGSICHKDSWLQYTERSYYRLTYAIKNQFGTSK